MADRTSNTYWMEFFERDFVVVPAQTIVAQFIETFKEFPPRMKAASFSMDQVLDKLQPQTGLK